MAAATGATASATCLRACNAQAYYSVNPNVVSIKNVHASTWEFGGKTYHVVAYKNSGIGSGSSCQVIDDEKQLDGNDPDAMIVRKGLADVLFIGHKDEFDRLKGMNWSNVAESLNAKATEVLSNAVVAFATEKKEEHASARNFNSIATERPDQKRRGSVFVPGEILETLREDEDEEGEAVEGGQSPLANQPAHDAPVTLTAAPEFPEPAAPKEREHEAAPAEQPATTEQQPATTEQQPATAEQLAPVAAKRSLAQRVTSHCNKTAAVVIAGIVAAWIISKL